MKLEEIEKLCADATSGPWNYNPNGRQEYEIGDIEFTHPDGEKKPIGWIYWSNNDASFIAASRTLLPKLLEIAKLAKASFELPPGLQSGAAHQQYFDNVERALHKAVLDLEKD